MDELITHFGDDENPLIYMLELDGSGMGSGDGGCNGLNFYLPDGAGFGYGINPGKGADDGTGEGHWWESPRWPQLRHQLILSWLIS